MNNLKSLIYIFPLTLTLSCGKPPEDTAKDAKDSAKDKLAKLYPCKGKDLVGVWTSNSLPTNVVMSVNSQCSIDITYKCGQTGKVLSFPKSGTVTITLNQDPLDTTGICLAKGKHTCNYDASSVDLTLNCDSNGNTYWDKY